ncbi:helix-turn-helix domain-containing protein [Cereibacter sp. SYSU M97828]|nr:helix-turn-helix domain-containing protein [Cereibacter flavus]
MAITALTGTRVRERRLAMGLRQSDLARAVGISGSYLNLIEHNRRRVATDVLARLAEVLDTDARALGEGAGGRVLDDLRAAAASGMAAPEIDRLEDFAGRFPGWAGLIAAQHVRLGALDRAVTALNDRMTHDPHLSHSLHEVLSAVASVRATAAILAETDDLTPEWQGRFMANLHGDSERLADGAKALAAHLDGPAAADPVAASPQEEMEAWLAARGWHVEGATEAELAGLSEAGRDLSRRWLGRLRAGEGLIAAFRDALQPGSAAGLVICDASGTLTFRKPTEGFDLPRFGAACPLWPLYAALAHGRPVEAEVAMPERRFRIRAFAESRWPEGLAGPEVREAAMLIEPSAATGAALAVGTTCRICPRDPCIARREPSILRE